MKKENTGITIGKKLLVVTTGAYPPVGGTSIVLNNILDRFNPSEIVLAGEQSYGTNLKDWTMPDYHVHFFRHSYIYGRRGSEYLKWLILPKIVKEFEQLIKDQKIDIVFGVFPGEFYVYAVYLAAKKLNKPFYTWWHNTYLDNRIGVLKILAKYIQAKLFNASKTIFTISEGMNNYLKNNYPDISNKLQPLLHGFEIPDRDINEISIDIEDKNKLRFLLTGNINHSNLDSTIRLVKTILNMKENHEVHYCGSSSKENWLAMGIDHPNLFIHGFIPFEDLIKKFSEVDIMLFTHGFGGKLTQAEYQTIFPTRTIPLLYSGKPILAHLPEDTSIHTFLNEFNCAEIVTTKNREDIVQSIEKLSSDKEYRKLLVSNAFVTVQKFDVNNTSKQLKDIINAESN